MARVSTKSPDEPKLEIMTTRVPVKMQTHAKTLANSKFRTLTEMHIAMIDRFLLERPWTRGLRWVESKALTGRDDDIFGQMRATGWIQTNFRLPPSMRDDVEKLAQEVDRSVSSVLYTTLQWWIWFVYTPPFEAEKRGNTGIKPNDTAILNVKNAA